MSKYPTRQPHGVQRQSAPHLKLMACQVNSSKYIPFHRHNACNFETSYTCSSMRAPLRKKARKPVTADASKHMSTSMYTDFVCIPVFSPAGCKILLLELILVHPRSPFGKGSQSLYCCFQTHNLEQYTRENPQSARGIL